MHQEHVADTVSDELPNPSEFRLPVEITEP